MTNLLRHMKVGFTGTRSGMTADQLSTLRERLTPPATNWDMMAEFHHGDCVGSDEQFHEMLRTLRLNYAPPAVLDDVRIIVHPPINSRYRAYCGVDEHWGTVILNPLPYVERNKVIVHASDVMIATPPGKEMTTPHSGTWITIGLARFLGKPLLIIWPDGSVAEENFVEHRKEDNAR